MTMITPSYLGETIEYSSLHACRSTLEDPTQDDRVAAAACFLPLTVNPRLSKELGSRHRAAIGLTEENDSVAIAVSEETGALSVVVDGQIERGLDTDMLRARLRSLLLHRGPARTREARVQYT